MTLSKWGDAPVRDLRADMTLDGPFLRVDVQTNDPASIRKVFEHPVREDSPSPLYGQDGQCEPGNGGLASPLPRLVGSPGVFDAIAVGATHSCALDFAGTAWCWGGATTASSLCGGVVCRDPVSISGHTFVGIEMGAAHACGLKSDRSVWCWGSNTHGGLGDGTMTDASAPVQLAGASADQVEAGLSYTCVRNGDEVRCVGYNAYGFLGDGTTSSSSVLVTAIPSGVTELVCGDWACAARVDGDWLAWGNNRSWSLVRGAPDALSTPTVMPDATSWTLVGPGSYATCGASISGAPECLGNTVRAYATSRSLGLPTFGEVDL